MVFATAAQHDQTLACRQSAMTRKWPCIPRALAGTDGSQTVGPAWERVVVLAVTGTKESDKRTISNASSATGPGATNPRHQRSCGAFTHGLVRVLGAIVGPHMTAGQAQSPECGGTGAQLVLTASLGASRACGAVCPPVYPGEARSADRGFRPPGRRRATGTSAWRRSARPSRRGAIGRRAGAAAGAGLARSRSFPANARTIVRLRRRAGNPVVSL